MWAARALVTWWWIVFPAPNDETELPGVAAGPVPIVIRVDPFRCDSVTWTTDSGVSVVRIGLATT
jgi:hypothetical protein